VKQCNVITNVLYIDEWFWFVSRSFSFFVWLVPIIYIFWKQRTTRTRQQIVAKKQMKKVSEVSGINNSQTLVSFDMMSNNASPALSPSGSPMEQLSPRLTTTDHGSKVHSSSDRDLNLIQQVDRRDKMMDLQKNFGFKIKKKDTGSDIPSYDSKPMDSRGTSFISDLSQNQ